MLETEAKDNNCEEGRLYRSPKGAMYPITKSLYYESERAGYCNVCGEVTIGHCTACPKWLCGASSCNRQHGIDETEGWS